MALPVYARRFALLSRHCGIQNECADIGLYQASRAPKLHLSSACRPRSFQTSTHERSTAVAGQDTYADPFANEDVMPGNASERQDVQVERRRAGTPSERTAQRGGRTQSGRRRTYGTAFDRERDSKKQSTSRSPSTSGPDSPPQSRPFRERSSYRPQVTQTSTTRPPTRRDYTNLQSQRDEDEEAEQRALIRLKARQEEEATLWRTQRTSLKSKFPTGWSPPKRLSPEALEGIRALNAQYPDQFNTPVLASHFKVSPESIRRILKSKWRPTGEEDEERRERWERRGESVWKRWVEMGKHAPKKWRMRGIGTGPRREGQDRDLQRTLREGGAGAQGDGGGVPWG